MKICGFQKLTLLDFPGHVACTIFTGGCNLRCPFCHNALLVTEVNDVETYEEQTILDYLRKRQGILDGVAITGGEPLIQKDIKEFIRKIRNLGYAVKLDTNGTYPEILKEIVSEGLVDYVAVDIKNSKEKYAETVGIPGFDTAPIEETVRYLLENHVDYEFRTTVVSEFHETEDIISIARWISGSPRYFLQNFVDSGNLIGENLHEVPREMLKNMAAEASLYVPDTKIRGID